jgi:4-aminobutyrate aminotransferase-like enzyme
MTMANAFGSEDFKKLSAEEQDLIARRERVLGPAYRLFYEHPVYFVRAEGVWLYDQQDRPYLDVYNNVASIGHANPAVVEAISRQSAILNTHTRYLHEGVLNYAEALTATFPSELSQMMFTCTGSEANDLAVRIARQFTGGSGIIVTKHAYHGVTGVVSEFSPSLGVGVDLGIHVRTIEPPRTGSSTAEDVGRIFAQEVQAAIDDLKRHGIKPAMLIVDTIFSSDGVIAGPAGFLQQAVATIQNAGGLFVADEVQPGFGRTGDAMWGFQRHGIVPDIVTIGKPMGNGYPVAGLIGKPDIIAPFGKNSRYFNTFGGSPVAAAAAQAVLDYVLEHRLMENARTVGDYLQRGLHELAIEDPRLGDIRGAGLFIGVDIVEDRQPAAPLATRLVNGLRKRRILISSSGPHANVLKIRPPLIFTTRNVDTFITALKDTLHSL